MLKKTGSFLILVAMLVTLAVGVGGASAAPKNQITELTILWAGQLPARDRQPLRSRNRHQGQRDPGAVGQLL